MNHGWQAGRGGWLCRGLVLLWFFLVFGAARAADLRAQVGALAAEVRPKGWVVFGMRSPAGDWDLAACRPDGSELRFVTRTPLFNEFAPQVSRDGRKLLYRRMPRAENLDNNRHGEQGQLMLSRADGSEPVALGKAGEWPWASLNPEASAMASLSVKGIAFVDLESRQVIRTLPRKGFFQQMTWSPDGQWLCGVANAFGVSWSIARMSVATGEANAVNLVDCCTPDWFPDSRQIIFSWRPRGQRANKGYGWTELWRATADGKTRQLVYAEDGRHVYGGHVSPDGQYVLFTGNVEEDGDPGRAGAPMALMRLADGPIIGGASPEARARHGAAKAGPVLTLPIGWEPCWTAAEIFTPPQASPGEAGTLAAEVRDRGWLVFSAVSAQGDWDLFRMRPDGSERRAITRTPGFNEAGARFSPDGRRILYYRMPRSEPVDNNNYGTFTLVLSTADGAQAVELGRGFSWASWGPDGRQVACLDTNGIKIIDPGTRTVVRQLPRHGLVSQLVWSPDGKHFAGTANGLGPFWNIGRVAVDTGEIKLLSEPERYNCTPDWTPDSRHVLYARGIVPEQGGRAELWVAEADGQSRRALYVEEGRHIYGACASPDGQYVIFTRSEADLGQVDHRRTTLAIIRWRDTPMVGDESPALRQRFPEARRGPRLDLGPGWEPHWTMAPAAPQPGTLKP